MTVPELILVIVYALIVFGLFYAGIAGLRGRPITMPQRSGLGTVTARGRGARVLGAVLVLLALMFLIPIVREVWLH